MTTVKTSPSPGVSIVIVSFNENTRLQASLSSIPLDIQNVEVILVVPASDETAIRIVDSKAFSRVRVVHDLGLGVYHAMNLGIAQANFSHLLFLNTGDLITGASQLQGCLSAINQNLDQSLVLPVAANWSNEINRANANLCLFLLGSPNNYVSHQGVLFSKLFTDQEGYLDQRYKVSADFKQLCLLYRNGRYKVLEIKLVAIEYPNYSARYNRRGRIETIAIILINLRGKIRIKSIMSRLVSETKSLLKKFS